MSHNYRCAVCTRDRSLSGVVLEIHDEAVGAAANIKQSAGIREVWISKLKQILGSGASTPDPKGANTCLHYDTGNAVGSEVKVGPHTRDDLAAGQCVHIRDTTSEHSVRSDSCAIRHSNSVYICRYVKSVSIVIMKTLWTPMSRICEHQCQGHRKRN